MNQNCILLNCLLNIHENIMCFCTTIDFKSVGTYTAGPWIAHSFPHGSATIFMNGILSEMRHSSIGLRSDNSVGMSCKSNLLALASVTRHSSSFESMRMITGFTDPHFIFNTGTWRWEKLLWFAYVFADLELQHCLHQSMTADSRYTVWSFLCSNFERLLLCFEQERFAWFFWVSSTLLHFSKSWMKGVTDRKMVDISKQIIKKTCELLLLWTEFESGRYPYVPIHVISCCLVYL